MKTFWLGIRISKTPTREKEREKTKKLKEKKPSSVQENKGDEEPAGDYQQKMSLIPVVEDQKARWSKSV